MSKAMLRALGAPSSSTARETAPNRAISVISDAVPYLRRLRPALGSVTATLLMRQLEFWFERHPAGFYKFLSPCDAPQYRIGDSWEEELGFSLAEFRSAFDSIAVRYVSKGAFEQAQDKFMGRDGRPRFYCSYYDRISRLTHYRRNDALIDAFIERLTCGKCISGGQGTLFPETQPISENSISADQETGDPDLRKVDFPSTIDPKTTTETTTQTTHAPLPPSPAARPAPQLGDPLHDPSGFVRFWNAWPVHKRKVNRKACLRKWRAENLEAMAERVIAAVEAFSRSPDWIKEGGEFIPMPLTWLNQGRWEAAAALSTAQSHDQLLAAGQAWKPRRLTPEEHANLRAELRLLKPPQQKIQPVIPPGFSFPPPAPEGGEQ